MYLITYEFFVLLAFTNTIFTVYTNGKILINNANILVLYSPGTVTSEGTVSQMEEYLFPIEKDTFYELFIISPSLKSEELQ